MIISQLKTDNLIEFEELILNLSKHVEANYNDDNNPLAGYFDIIEKLKKNKLQIPVYAIGGITLRDVGPLMETGIHGIAVSGIITQSDEKEKLIQQLNKKLYADIIV
mgnify:CR=1 FL=1